ncbi:Ornithine carbamoyltransferase [bioreactor metagenome]|uniref:Ornithine carbamoyltransferase n=1 Tax=bioreactor metagenome TaxID=1076179 RepID=A0A645HIL7_9ZZZZ
MAYCGDARFNMGNSLMVGCAKMGLDFVACAPKEYWPSEELTNTCKALAKQSGGSITQTEDILSGVKDADVIYTDVWVSMGEPMEVWEQRIKELSPYQVNAKVMQAAKPSAIFMHCLPAFHDLNTTIGKEMGARFHRDSMEVSDDVFSSPQSVVFDEAENRMHTIKAVMLATL